MMRRKVLLLALAAAGVAGVVWFWPRPRPNLLLITLDTTRADRIGCYGYAPARTPALDALAASGVLCERACTVAPLTLPAHASLFTGLYPAENGVRTNGRGRLDDSLPTLADVLRRQGYDTAAFVAAFVLDSKFGLARGFKTYDDDIAGDESGGDALLRQRTGEAVVDAALAWLGRPRSAPFFCWVHLYDPHAPYLDHTDLFGDEFAGRPYDAEIAYDDRQVGRLLEFLKTRGLDAGTLVVVVGDHGEGLGQHVEQTHGSTLYDVTMRVPLLFRLPGRLASGRSVPGNISLVDVFPTVLELLGLKAAPRMSGRSVKAALEGATKSESLCYGATDEPFLIDGWSPLRSLTDGRWKYIRTTRVELYDLASDPQELHNLAENDPDRTREMESHLAEFESRLVPRAEVQVQISGAERRALASLGYTGGAGAPPAVAASAHLADVKDMLPFDIAVDEANKLKSDGSVEAATERLRAIVRDAPAHTRANWSLAWALWDQSREDEAMDVFLSLLALKPDSRDAHNGLATMLLYRDRPADAIPEFLKVLDIDPEFAEAHYNVAKACLQTGQPREALPHLNAVLEIDPRHAGAWQWRAHVLGGLGQIDAAIADCREAVKYAPDSPEAHHNLGAFLAEHGDAVEAEAHLARAVELNPASAEFHYALGTFLVRRRRHDEAIEQLLRAVELKAEFPAAQAALKSARALSDERRRSP
jgi:arylsulfatase A-like enzyme/Tfp pilus assembly protein PilF